MKYKLRLNENEAGIMGSELIEALNAEGLYFFGGYTPLYMQPLYQQKKLFTHGYPWSAEENRNSPISYQKGICPVAEKLTTSTITSEHIRPPNRLQDMQDIVDIFRKVMD